MEKIIKNVSYREYSRIHYWLRKNFGRATKCAKRNCPKGSTRFNWALRPGKLYEAKIENFFQLCRSCHSKIDLTKDGIRRIKEAGRKRTNDYAVRAMVKANTGKARPPDVVKKIIDGNSLPILKMKNGEIVERFASITEAKKYGYNAGGTWQALNGRIKSYKGFQWKYE